MSQIYWVSLSTSDLIESWTTADRRSDWQPVFLDVIMKKSLEKLLGSDVQLLCQPDELWQKKQTNRETGCTLLEDNPVWYAEDQKSWFANFCTALKWPWNDTMDCKHQRGRQRPWAVDGCDGWGECVMKRCVSQQLWKHMENIWKYQLTHNKRKTKLKQKWSVLFHVPKETHE